MDFIDSEIKSIEEQLQSLQFGSYDKIWATLKEAATQAIQKNFDSSNADAATDAEDLKKIANQEKLNEFAEKYRTKGSLKQITVDQFTTKAIMSEILNYMAGVCINAVQKDHENHVGQPLFSSIFNAHHGSEVFVKRLNAIIDEIQTEIETVLTDYYGIITKRDLDGLLDRTWEMLPISGTVNGILSLLSVSIDMLSGLRRCLNPFDKTPYAERLTQTGRNLFSVALSLVKIKLSCILTTIPGLGAFSENVANIIVDFLSVLLVSMIILCYQGSVHNLKKPNEREINDLYLRLETLRYIHHSQWQIDVVQKIDQLYAGADYKQQLSDNLEQLRLALNHSQLNMLVK